MMTVLWNMAPIADITSAQSDHDLRWTPDKYIYIYIINHSTSHKSAVQTTLKISMQTHGKSLKMKI